MGYLKKGADGSLLYSVVNAAEPDADGGWPLSACCSLDLCSYSVILKSVTFVVAIFPGMRRRQ